MTKTSYRRRATLHFRIRFFVETLPCCPVASWCKLNDDKDILPLTLGGGCSSPFFRRGTTLLSGGSLEHAERWQRHPTSGTQRWVFVPFSVEAKLWCPVASCCTRNDNNDILPQPLGGGCSSLFSSRHNSTVRSRLGARGTMSTLCYRVRAARVCLSNFSVQALLSCPVASWCTRNDDNDILPRPRGGGCSSPFPVEALLCSPVASWCTRNDDNDNLPRTFSGGCSSLFFPSRQYSGVRLRLVARGTMTTTSYRSRSAEGVRHFFRRGTTLLSGRVLVHAER
ncbi:uncharacterized protein TNCV_4587521 [Trichonephila clavipes]|uniref:Uncharacterized protein n=1 Tax=Trichonephila clavipes TaxID=2585209 RepID=A0A8X6RZS4_TRICX|nr:uncharacterized protein TNCV_4587521 [Trichonephila clavipes]